MVNHSHPDPLHWQSKVVLLLVVPWTVASALLQAHWWATQMPQVAWQTIGISVAFGLIVWKLRAATPAAAATGAVITASLIFANASAYLANPYSTGWLRTGLSPLLAVFLLTFIATKIGKAQKARLGTAESKRGRNAAQVSANLGAAALLVSFESLLGWEHFGETPNLGCILALSALAEAAADTVSSEIGQVLGGQPRMLTTLRRVPPGTDGGVTFAGTLAGIAAAMIVAAIGSWALGEDWLVWIVCVAGATLGLFFDSLLGATLERRGRLNNDAVNFLSTLSAPVFSVLVMIGWYFLLAKRIR